MSVPMIVLEPGQEPVPLAQAFAPPEVEETCIVLEPGSEPVPLSQAFPTPQDLTYIVFTDEKGKRRRILRTKYEGR